MPFTPAWLAPADILEERIQLAMTIEHYNHPGVPGVVEGVGGCPRCNAEYALFELKQRAVDMSVEAARLRTELERVHANQGDT